MFARLARSVGIALTGVIVLAMAAPALAQEGETLESLLDKSGLIYEKRQLKGKVPLYVLPYTMDDGRLELMAEEVEYEAKYKDDKPVRIISIWARIVVLGEGQKLPAPVVAKIAEINLKAVLGHCIYTDQVVVYTTSFTTRGGDAEALRMTMNFMASLASGAKKELDPILKALAEEK